MPLVSVLMPVYNGGRYLRNAVESILNQTFADFELLIIDDGSTDQSVRIIQSYNDPRIRMVSNTTNLGLVPSLNKGIDLVRGKYIARMDADDISLPQRLAKQVVFMETHPDVGVCGSRVVTIGDCKGLTSQSLPDSDMIRCVLFFENTLAHPSVMIRKELLDRLGTRYDPNFKHVEDYELWIRCSPFTRFANIEEILIQYRWHSESISRRVPQEQQSAIRRIWRAQLQRLEIFPTDKEFAIHQAVATWKFEPNSKAFLADVDCWLQKIKSANDRTPCYPEPVFSRVLAERWFAACCTAMKLGTWTWKTFRSSPLSVKTRLVGWKPRLKCVAKFGVLSFNKTSENTEGSSKAYGKLKKTKFSNYFR